MKNKLAIILYSDWHTAKKKVPKLARQILSHYAHIWCKGEDEKEVEDRIQLVWDNKLSSVTYPFRQPGWTTDWDKVKVWWVADKLEEGLPEVKLLNMYSQYLGELQEHYPEIYVEITDSHELKGLKKWKPRRR